MAAATNSPTTLTGRKIAGLVAQLGSFATTWACINAIGLPSLPGFGIAVVVEVVLFYAKKMAFENGRESVGWCAVLLDTLLNAGGIWPFSKNLSATPTWVMLAEALSLKGQMGPIAALIIALVLGFILSILPHRLLDE